MNRVFPQLPIPERLALEFLGTFARCEYALKASEFARGGANSAEADWDAFADNIDPRFNRFDEADFRAAVDFLLTESPRKQVLRNGHLEWKRVPPNTKLPRARQTLVMVRRIRNNLFHGAKVWSPEYDNRPRDIQLLKAALIVLRCCARLNHRVHTAYEHGVF